MQFSEMTKIIEAADLLSTTRRRRYPLLCAADVQEIFQSGVSTNALAMAVKASCLAYDMDAETASGHMSEAGYVVKAIGRRLLEAFMILEVKGGDKILMRVAGTPYDFWQCQNPPVTLPWMPFGIKSPKTANPS